MGWITPNGQRNLSVQASESSASLIGRIAADAATIVLGVDNVAAGTTIATGGTVVACGATLCLGAGATVAGGVAVAAVGASQISQGAIGLGGNLAMLAGSGGGQNSSGGLFASNNIPTQSHFWDRLSEYGWTEDQAFKVYQNGKKYTNQYGQNVRWDPKSGLTLIIDPDDGRVITPEWNPKPMRNWEQGWFDPK